MTGVYNSILSPEAKDRKGACSRLLKEMDAVKTKRAEVEVRVGEMDAEADTLFKSWAQSTSSISDAGLRARSEERLAATKARYGEIHAAGGRARDVYGSLMMSLQDQVAFMGHDLNNEAIAALAPDAQKLNAQAQAVIAAINQTTATANSNIAALSPE